MFLNLLSSFFLKYTFLCLLSFPNAFAKFSLKSLISYFPVNNHNVIYETKHMLNKMELITNKYNG